MIMFIHNYYAIIVIKQSGIQLGACTLDNTAEHVHHRSRKGINHE